MHAPNVRQIGMRTAGFAIFFSVLFAWCDAREPRTLPALWSSAAYSEVKPFPSIWLPPSVPLRVLAFSEYEKLDAHSLSIRAVISRFGRPTRYLTPTKKNEFGFMIYDLPSGHSVAAYVCEPPSDWIAAIALLDPNGRVLRLIK